VPFGTFACYETKINFGKLFLRTRINLVRTPVEMSAEQRRLIEEIRKAERAYRDAAIKTLEISNEFADLPPGHTDGSFAVRHALQRENTALTAYKVALRALVESVGRDPQPGSNEGLTTREREVLQQIALGKSTKQIAYTLGITFKTAASHRAHILVKLNAGNAADLTRAAIRSGLVDP